VTVGELLSAATARLAAAGVGSPRVDAELLAADLFDVERPELLMHLSDEVDAAIAAEYESFVERRAAREPLQHITGLAPFRYLLLEVGPGVFVPRPETELLVDAVLTRLSGIEAPVVVDLCSGSGALAVAVEDELPTASITAVEADPDALVWLGRNTEESGVRVVAGDVRDPELLAELRGRVDAVVSNPPYVPDATAVDPEVRADPALAVFAGTDGLALVPHVVARAAELLRAGGVLVMEHDETHGEAVPALLAADGRWGEVTDCPDLTGRPRYVVAVRE
jgi:release factor glutamine methyltransferase